MAARRSATEASKLPSRSFFFFFLLLFFFHFVLNSLFSHSPIVEKKKNTLISSSLPLFFFGRRSLSLSLSLDAPAPHAPIYHAFAAAPLWSLRLFSLAAAGVCRRFPEGSKRPQKVDLLLCFSSSFNLPFTLTLTRQQTRLLLLRRPPPRRAVSSVSAAAMSSSASHHRFGDAEMEAAAAELVPPLAGKSRARDFSFLLLSFLFFFSLSFSVSKK